MITGVDRIWARTQTAELVAETLAKPEVTDALGDYGSILVNELERSETVLVDRAKVVIDPDSPNLMLMPVFTSDSEPMLWDADCAYSSTARAEYRDCTGIEVPDKYIETRPVARKMMAAACEYGYVAATDEAKKRRFWPAKPIVMFLPAIVDESAPLTTAVIAHEVDHALRFPHSLESQLAAGYDAGDAFPVLSMHTYMERCAYTLSHHILSALGRSSTELYQDMLRRLSGLAPAEAGNMLFTIINSTPLSSRGPMNSFHSEVSAGAAALSQLFGNEPIPSAEEITAYNAARLV